MAVEWLYDPDQHRYYRDGVVVPIRELVRTRDQFAAAQQALLRALGEQLDAGTISITEWETQFRAIAAETLTALHMFGAGGEAMVRDRPIHIIRLIQALERQIPYANEFVRQVRTGEIETTAIAARSELYVGAGITAYEQARSDDWGITLPFYPADGDTECLANCRCSWELSTSLDEDTGRDVTMAVWQTEGDDKVCASCMGRGALFPEPGVVVG